MSFYDDVYLQVDLEIEKREIAERTERARLEKLTVQELYDELSTYNQEYYKMAMIDSIIDLMED